MKVPGFTAEFAHPHAAGQPYRGLLAGTRRGVLPQAIHRHPPLKLELGTPRAPHICHGVHDCVQLYHDECLSTGMSFIDASTGYCTPS